MKRLIIGIVCGLVLGSATGAAAARLLGDSYLWNWDVVDQNGTVLCSDPYVWQGTHEIECDLDQ